MNNATDTHQCPAWGCARQVARAKLMCWDHWKLVPAHLRARVWNTWLAEAGSDAHLAAIVAAIAAANERLAARAVRP